MKSWHLLYMEKYAKFMQRNNFKILALTWTKEFELPGGSYSVSDIQDCIEYM